MWITNNAENTQKASSSDEGTSITTCGMILKIPFHKLESLFGVEKANFLFRMCNGIQDERVLSRSEAQTFCSVKSFKHQYLGTLSQVDRWLGEFAGELYERMVDHRSHYDQVPTQVNVGVDFEVNHNLSHVSKSMRIDIGRGGSVSKLAEVAQSCFRKIIAPHNKFKVMGMSLSLTSFIKLEKCGIAMKSWIASKRSQQMKKVSSSSTETGSSMDKPFSSTSSSSIQPPTINPAINPAMLYEMKNAGVSENDAISALRLHNNNIDEAYEYIFSNPAVVLVPESTNNSELNNNNKSNKQENSKFVGIVAEEVDENVLNSLPSFIVKEIRKEMVLEASTKKRSTLSLDSSKKGNITSFLRRRKNTE